MRDRTWSGASLDINVTSGTSWFTTRTLESFVHIPTTLPLLVLPRLWERVSETEKYVSGTSQAKSETQQASFD